MIYSNPRMEDFLFNPNGYSISIDQNRNVSYNGKDFVFRKGNVDGKINESDWEYLSKIVSTMNVNVQQQEYNVNWTCDQTGILELHFSDNSMLYIRDYGKRGNLKLALIYNFIQNNNICIGI